jgi:hydroxypyruvate isomerase
MAGVAAATGAFSIIKGKGMPKVSAAASGPFADVKLRMSCPLDLFKGSVDERLEQVAKWGFSAYEWLGPSGDFDAIGKKAASLGLELSCMGGAGAIAAGQMVLPDDHDKLVAQFEKNIPIAKKLNCRHLIGLSGNERADCSRDEQMANVIACTKRLAPIAEKNEVLLVLEALNPLVDHKGYFLTRTDQTMTILKEVNSPNVKMLFDIYHQQITEGNVTRNLTENIDRIGHFHVADNPGRKQPGTGELNYKNIFKAIAATNYKEFVALECGCTTKDKEDILRATLECLKA